VEERRGGIRTRHKVQHLSDIIPTTAPLSLLAGTSTATLLFYCEEYLRPRRSPTSEIFSRASSSCSRVCDDDRQKRARLSMMGVAGYLKINDDACLFVCLFVCFERQGVQRNAKASEWK
jgi:hypothetical protein